MPRKVNYGLDYDEDYDMYDDYDYDYDHDSDVERDGGMLEVRQAIAKPGIWRCSICTYDNDESMPVCDICGVFRNPPVNVSSTGSKKTVDDMCKDSGASIMAKSLFASLPRRTPKMAIIFQQESDDFVRKEANNFHRTGNPFKFDRPSPDDLVSEGKNSSRKVSKGVPSNANEKVGTVKLPHAKKSECSLVSLPKGLLSTTNENVGTYKMPNVKSIEGSSVSLPKGSQFHADESICSSVNEEKPQSLASSFTDVTLSEKSGSSKTVNSKRATSHAEYKPEKWMLPEQNEGILTQLNLAIVGHVDSGKSTLSGRLLHLLGRISQKEMHKFEKEAKLKGKGSFAYAWALDESAEERERGITMTVAVAYFDSKKYHVVVLDSPGHKDFVPNMISGATQADAAILVIDASVGSFETGMDSNGGQTREHAQLIRSFGVDEIIVGINKMDAVSYSKERFDTIKMQLGTFLRSCGFKDSFVSWIPLSAMENQNLVKAASDIRLSSWYQGSHLLDAIDSLHPPIRDTVKPLRMPICDVIRSHLQGQVAASGKLESGAIRSGSKVLVMPSGDVATVRSLERDSQCCTIARAGDNVAVSLQGIDGGRVMAGGVLCHPDFPVAVATRLELKVLVLDIVMPILVGSQIEFHIYHAKEAARVVRIISLIDQKTGKVTKKAPRCLTSKQSAVIEVVLDGAVCVEEFSKCRALGRVFLRSSGRTIAVGIVSRIIEQ